MHISGVVLGGMCLLLAAGPAAGGVCTPHWDASPGQPGFNSNIAAFAVFDRGDGEEIYAAGDFTMFGATPMERVARWDGATWHDVGFDLMDANWLNDIIAFDGHLYVGGVFDINGGLDGGLARWDGDGSWQVPGGGVSNPGSHSVWSFGIFDDGEGEALYVGGRFNGAGGVPVNNVAKWDGENWHDVGGGLHGAPSTNIFAMVVWDDGRGPALYVAGRFTTAGDDVAANHIARWDGKNWEAVGGGLFNTGGVSALAVFDDGTGEHLYAAGNQFSASGMPNTPVARFDGESWSIPAGGVTGWGRGLGVFDDGDGEALYFAGGGTVGHSGMSCGRIVRFDGNEWSCFGDGLFGGSSALGLMPFDDGNGPALFIGGSFNETGDGQTVSSAAAWRGCATDAVPGDLNGDGVVNVDDLLILIAAWGSCENCDDCPADLTGDCTVGVADLLILLANWG